MFDETCCCGTCRHHEPSSITLDWLDKRDWFCMCEEADAYGLATEYSDSCEEWEER